MGININIVDYILLTTTYSDTDLGVLQKFVESKRMEIISTKTIIDSFLRKYSGISQIPVEFM